MPPKIGYGNFLEPFNLKASLSKEGIYCYYMIIQKDSHLPTTQRWIMMDLTQMPSTKGRSLHTSFSWKCNYPCLHVYLTSFLAYNYYKYT